MRSLHCPGRIRACMTRRDMCPCGLRRTRPEGFMEAAQFGWDSFGEIDASMLARHAFAGRFCFPAH